MQIFRLLIFLCFCLLFFDFLLLDLGFSWVFGLLFFLKKGLCKTSTTSLSSVGLKQRLGQELVCFQSYLGFGAVI